MKKLTTRAVLIAAAFMACKAALGQPVPNDLYLGFDNQAGGGTADYIVNLGSVANITNATSVLNLSSDINAADLASAALAGESSSTIEAGVIGGQNNDYTPTTDIFFTQLRNGGAEVAPAQAGSVVTASAGRSDNDHAFDVLSQLAVPSPDVAGASLMETNLTTTGPDIGWEVLVDLPLNNGSQSFYAATGFNPSSTVNQGGVLYEDLWGSSTTYAPEPYVYLGYFTLDPTGSSPKFTFTPPSAPAPLVAPTIQSVAQTAPNTITVSWSSVATHSYQLQYTINLLTGPWVNVGSATTAAATTMTNADTAAVGPQRFYRVMAQ